MLMDPLNGNGIDFDPNMSETQFQYIVQKLLKIEKKVIRDAVAKNTRVKEFITSHRFLVEYARLVGISDRLPPQKWLEKQEELGGCFKCDTNEHRFNLQDYVFDQTRYGFACVDIPCDISVGIVAIEDYGGCTSPCAIRNLFVFENANSPICRFNPLMFCQKWIFALLRPKFILRGMVACPKGDWGYAKFILEMGKDENEFVRKESLVSFKKDEQDKCGQFVPFEVETPDYDFIPNFVSIVVLTFYINRVEIATKGLRISNLTVQCVLPNPNSLDTLSNLKSVHTIGPDSRDELITSPIFFCSPANEAAYLKNLKKSFCSVLRNAKNLSNEKVERMEREVEEMLAGDLLGERMEVGETTEKRRHDDENHDEPAAKKRC